MPTITKKTNNKKWWIVSLALILVLAISGAVFSSLNQKMSTSKADTSNIKPISTIPKLCKVAGIDKPCPKPPIKPKINPSSKLSIRSEINPYTGVKQ